MPFNVDTQHDKAILLGLCALNRADIPMDVIKLVAKKVKRHYSREKVLRRHRAFQVGCSYMVAIYTKSTPVEVLILARKVSKSGKVTIEYRVVQDSRPHPWHVPLDVSTRQATVKAWYGGEAMQVRVVRNGQTCKPNLSSFNATGVALQTREEIINQNYARYGGD